MLPGFAKASYDPRTGRAVTPAVGSILPLSVAFLVAAACAPDEPGDASRVVSDSAGTEIVTIAPPQDLHATQWVTDSAPRLDIGVVAGPEAFELSEVQGAVRLRDGGIVIGNGGVPDLRFFGPNGDFRRSVGGDGEGPGEFRSIDYLTLLGSDTILVHDQSLQRASLFDFAGTFLGTRRLGGMEDNPYQYVAGVVNSTTPITWGWDISGFDEDQIGVFAVPAWFGISDLHDGTFRMLGIYPSTVEGNIRRGGRAIRAIPAFARKGDIAAGGHFFFILTSADDSSIEVFDSDGVLRRILRLQVGREPADASAIEAWTESWITKFAEGSEDLAARMELDIRETPRPEYIPVFRSLEVDADGNVCAERYPHTMDQPRRYWCFSPDGHFLRSVLLPPGLVRDGHPHFEPQLEFGADYVLGVWQDDLDVEHVHMYDLVQR
jgi:hypothetical protein